MHLPDRKPNIAASQLFLYPPQTRLIDPGTHHGGSIPITAIPQEQQHLSNQVALWLSEAQQVEMPF